MLNRLIYNFRKNFPSPLKRLFLKIKFFGFKHYCNVCNSHLRRFLPGGLNEKIIKELEIAGGGYHEYDYCPVCKASYRQRLVKLYIDKSDTLKNYPRVLHIAPEESLYHVLRKKNKKRYVCGDLMPERYTYYSKPLKVNLLDIRFPNNSFDLVVCNHVLEHIPDDKKAMSEIFRVLDNNGIAILQVPISLKLSKTFEDHTIQSEEDRLKKFGQRDHVRIYAMDYTDRLKEEGFYVDILPKEYFADFKYFNKLMLDDKEVLFVARKMA